MLDKIFDSSKDIDSNVVTLVGKLDSICFNVIGVWSNNSISDGSDV